MQICSFGRQFWASFGGSRVYGELQAGGRPSATAWALALTRLKWALGMVCQTSCSVPCTETEP